MVGLGVANLASAFFQSFPISSSSSRTPVAEAAGAKTQLTGVVGALAIALLLVFAPEILQDLPHPALAAVVIAAAIGLFEVSDLRRIYRIQRWKWRLVPMFPVTRLLARNNFRIPRSPTIDIANRPITFYKPTSGC